MLDMDEERTVAAHVALDDHVDPYDIIQGTPIIFLTVFILSCYKSTKFMDNIVNIWVSHGQGS